VSVTRLFGPTTRWLVVNGRSAAAAPATNARAAKKGVIGGLL
jgi:hypothetical protein